MITSSGWMAIPKENVLYCEKKKPGLGRKGDPTPCREVGKESREEARPFIGTVAKPQPSIIFNPPTSCFPPVRQISLHNGTFWTPVRSTASMM